MTAQTFILLQATNHWDSSRWLEFATVSKAMNALISRFEQKLSEANPHLTKVTYELQDLYFWIDGMRGMQAMVYQQTSGLFAQRDRIWIKQQIAATLQAQQ